MRFGSGGGRSCQRCNCHAEKAVEVYLSPIIKKDYIYDKMLAQIKLYRLRNEIPQTFAEAMQNIQALYYGDLCEDEKIKKKLAKSVVEYIWMEQGGHLKYGISFIAAQVI